MSHRRATVVIRQRDPEAVGGYCREWVHKDDLEYDRDGVTLNWPSDQTAVFIPYPSLIRVDYEPCDCSECSRRAA